MSVALQMSYALDREELSLDVPLAIPLKAASAASLILSTLLVCWAKKVLAYVCRPFAAELPSTVCEIALKSSIMSCIPYRDESQSGCPPLSCSHATSRAILAMLSLHVFTSSTIAECPPSVRVSRATAKIVTTNIVIVFIVFIQDTVI